VDESTELKPNETTIYGKKVIFKTAENMAAEDHYDLPRVIALVWAGGAPALEHSPAFLARIVDSWELDSDPRLEASYGKLNIIALTVLATFGVQYVQKLMEEVQQIAPKSS
jgi:hypothetical protein